MASLDEIAALLKQALVRIEVPEAENQRLRDRVSELEKELVEEQRKGKRQAGAFRFSCTGEWLCDVVLAGYAASQ